MQQELIIQKLGQGQNNLLKDIWGARDKNAELKFSILI